MIMTGHAFLTPDFKGRLQESLDREKSELPTIRVGKHQAVYMCGESADMVYVIQSGQVKLLMLSPEGKECLLAIYTSGDIFGELRLAAAGPRQEIAIAMEDTTLKRIPIASFFRHLSRHALLEGFVDYLAARVADQQSLIANLIIVDSKHRLGETLLFLAHKLGQPDSRSTLIKVRITHEELAQMVGTTRPRITTFMQAFRARDLIEITPDHFLIVKESKLLEYLARPS
jgi:CRP/FNR family transcriptional regulator, cyclic AMP receptor protein